MQFVTKEPEFGTYEWTNFKWFTRHTFPDFKLPSAISKLFCQWTDDEDHPYVTYTCLGAHDKTTTYAKDCPYFDGNEEADGSCKCCATDFPDITPFFYIKTWAGDPDPVAGYEKDCIIFNTSLGTFPVVNPFL